MDRRAALYDTFILILVTLVFALHTAKDVVLCRSPHRDFYQGLLFGCLSNLFFDVCFCFSEFCFCPFSLSFLPPLSPITSLLFLFSKTSSLRVVSVATTADSSLLILILHTFQNQSITVFRKNKWVPLRPIMNLSQRYPLTLCRQKRYKV